MSLLAIRNLKTWLPTGMGFVKAVNTVYLEIEPGESLGLIGETGCGKSILGSSITRLLPPGAELEGEILYNGKNILELSDSEMRRIRGGEIAMILQNPTASLNPVLKIGIQIGESFRLHRGLDKRKARDMSRELLNELRFPFPEKAVDSYPHEFSGGMKERAMIAMALACSPSLIIADEPTKGLDLSVKRTIIKLLKTVSEDKAMLFITHDLDAAFELCGRVAVMYAGEIVESGRTEDVFENPLHPYTRAFLDSLPGRGLKPIPGMSPSLIELPSGCRFHPRCEFVEERCRCEHPDMVNLENTHSVRCLLYA
ncbi:Oligopeptide transport ATP-binding protein OppD [Methanosarcina sp. MTP4]|uniref:ABC transporter ATP-binding protein n=1 Tax=Methanosarcina sp. MTP4 TaxID=1434100 RepID=UPI0006159564|nr:ABC transporter ATP-binding protein [Methanosarcina sp. MTP4]AKB23522.1 Oligopeptide transport ATP-binding protein OppD [Methanosarcina sp. MTP4]